MITIAANHGLLVLLDPAETGGWLTCLLHNGATACRAYGQYLGNRYKSFTNIVWLSGNDFQGWRTAGNDGGSVQRPRWRLASRTTTPTTSTPWSWITT